MEQNWIRTPPKPNKAILHPTIESQRIAFYVQKISGEVVRFQADPTGQIGILKENLIKALIPEPRPNMAYLYPRIQLFFESRQLLPEARLSDYHFTGGSMIIMLETTPGASTMQRRELN
jgi:hypothetical protein